jgi:Protein of unknown function (DUF1822)
MIYPMKSFNGSVVLERAAHQLADRFCQSQSDEHKAEQVYYNTLAVYAVSTYLSTLGFETDLDAGDSWDSLMQTGLNVADLVVKQCGRLECRPVLPGSNSMHIPAEAWENRIGYMAVQLNPDLDEATLLGFVETVTEEDYPLEQLRSLSDLPAYLDQLYQSESVGKVTHLGLWFQHQIDAVWQTVEDLWSNPTEQLAFSFRSATQLSTDAFQLTEDAILRVKRLDLGLQQGAEQMALLVAIQPTDAQEVEVSMQVCAVEKSGLLPQNLTMTVFDAQGKQMMQSQSGSASLEFQFNAEVGERFSLQVAIDNFSIIEEFIV